MADKYSHAGDALVLPRASTTVVDVGDILTIDSGGEAVVVSAATQLVYGVAETSHATGVAGTVTVNVPDGNKVYDMVLSAATTAYVGAKVKYASDKKITKCTIDENAIGEVAEALSTSGTAVRVRLYKIEKVDWVFSYLFNTCSTTSCIYFSMPAAANLKKAELGVGNPGGSGSFTANLYDDSVSVFTTAPTLAYNASAKVDDGDLTAASQAIAAASVMCWQITAIQGATIAYPNVSLQAIFSVDGYAL